MDVFVPASGSIVDPTVLVFGPDGNLYVASQANSSVTVFNGATGTFLSTFVPQGSGGLSSPNELLFFTPGASSVPEPETLTLFGIGMGILLLAKLTLQAKKALENTSMLRKKAFGSKILNSHCPQTQRVRRMLNSASVGRGGLAAMGPV